MSGRQYRVVSQLAEAVFPGADDGVVELELSASDEADWTAGGHLELLPSTYRVLSVNFEHPRGHEYEAAMPLEIEAALVQGGHIELVDYPADEGPESELIEEEEEG